MTLWTEIVWPFMEGLHGKKKRKNNNNNNNKIQKKN